MRIHLGCGLRYLDGYLNIDFPPANHSVQRSIKADRFADIRTISFEAESLDEVRLHHVFEHFTRPVALALLCRWREWLKTGGTVRIETPDAMASIKSISSFFCSFDVQQQIFRHLFGSHEAAWAVHCDAWYQEKFQVVLETLGFENFSFQKSSWGNLNNIEVVATKTTEKIGFDQFQMAVKELLTQSTIRVSSTDPAKPEGTELEMLNVWMVNWEAAYKGEIV